MSTTDADHDRLEEVSNVQVDDERLLTLGVPPAEPVEDALDRAESHHEDAGYLYADTEAQVSEALSALRWALDEYATAPSGGLVACAGIVDGETVSYTFPDPPATVEAVRVERGEEFATELLGAPDDADESAAAAEAGAGASGDRTYGLLVVEHGKAILGTFGDGELTILESFGSERPEDNPMEGSLSDREAEHREFFERVARRAGVHFLGVDPDEERRGDAEPDEQEADPVAGLFVGGSSVTASEFLDGEYLDHRLRNRVVDDAFAVGDASEDGLEQLAEKARDRVRETERARLRDLLDDFISGLDGDEAVAGQERTEEALQYEGVETLLVSATIPTGKRQELGERTRAQGGDIEVIPTDLEGHDRLDRDGAVGALVRFPIE